MPIRKQDYPPDWDAISLQVRTDAGWRCEWCGAPGGKVIQRFSPADARKVFNHPDYPGWDFLEIDQVGETTGELVATATMTWRRLRFHGLTRIILTTAHLDRNPANNARENLAALCQRCHLRHDIRQHIANRRYGRDHARAPQMKLEL